MAKRLTYLRQRIIRHLPKLNLVVRLDESGIAVRAYRCRKWKTVSWEQLASLADDTKPVVKLCETLEGSRVLKAMGAHLPSDSIAGPT